MRCLLTLRDSIGSSPRRSSWNFSTAVNVFDSERSMDETRVGLETVGQPCVFRVHFTA